MKLKTIIDFLEDKIPSNLALDEDNVGLVGEYDLDLEISSMEVFMDLIPEHDNFSNETDDSTYIIENLDSGRSLHPLLTYHFVNKFLNLVNKRNCQLIITTHETILLNQDLLRRDEIWFVDKNTEGEGIVYSLDDFNIRFDKVIEKAYLEGRYGGVPIFKPLFLQED